MLPLHNHAMAKVIILSSFHFVKGVFKKFLNFSFFLLEILLAFFKELCYDKKHCGYEELFECRFLGFQMAFSHKNELVRVFIHEGSNGNPPSRRCHHGKVPVLRQGRNLWHHRVALAHPHQPHLQTECQACQGSCKRYAEACLRLHQMPAFG